jgi:hypothetical protein
MDIIREHLMYKNDALKVCMKQLSSQEQYEFIRIVLESKTDKISVCMHGSTNFYIDMLLKKLPIELVEDCSQKQQEAQLVFEAKQ